MVETSVKGVEKTSEPEPRIGFLGYRTDIYDSKNFKAICTLYGEPEQVIRELEAHKDMRVLGITEAKRDEFRTSNRTCIYFKK